jgi:hypothetical protein
MKLVYLVTIWPMTDERSQAGGARRLDGLMFRRSGRRLRQQGRRIIPICGRKLSCFLLREK